MIKDGSGKHNLGFGIPLVDHKEEPGVPEPGNSNAVQKSFVGNPAIKFFATMTASMVAMHVAGKVAKEGGIRLAYKLQDQAKSSQKIGRSISEGVNSFRKIQAELDALQGVTRKYVDPGDKSILVKKSPDGRWIRDTVTQTDGYHFRHMNPKVPDWQLRDEIQQRLVKQARRLPYELPGFYAFDKFLIDPILGNDQDKKKVDWSNPFDVIGDFAYESVKNTAFNVIPFEGVIGSSKHSYRKMMSHMMENPNNSTGIVSLKTTLEMVGADVSDLLNKTVRFSNQTMGAFSQLVQDASENQQTFSQFVKSQSTRSVLQTPPIQNSRSARRTFDKLKNTFSDRDLGKSALDTMPGPFKGMGTALSMLKDNAKKIGKTYDDWQEVVAGRLDIDRLAKTDPDRAQAIRAFMQKGGGTYIEQFARSSYHLGRGGPTLPDGRINPDWKRGQFYRGRSQDIYNANLIEALSETTGLTPEAATKFVRLSSKITPYPGGKAPFAEGENLIERIQFGKNKVHTNSTGEWWDSIIRGVGKHGIPFDPNKLTLSGFSEAVKKTDLRYSSSNFKQLMDEDIASQWNHLHGQVLPQYAVKSLTGAAPFETFANSQLGRADVRDELIRRTSSRLGVRTVDNAGNPMEMAALRDQIRSRGLNPNDPHQLRGFLIHNKDIKTPWSKSGANIFGLRSMTIHEAMENGYFAGNTEAVRKEISYFVDQRHGPGRIAGRGGARDIHARGLENLGRVYTNANGNVIDLGRIRRSLTASLDTFASDTQIPLLHFNPLQLGFYKNYQQMRNALPIQIMSNTSLQPGQILGKNADFYTFIKTKGSKGRVHAIIGNDTSGVRNELIEGTFRPFMTNIKTMGGRYSELFTTGETSAPSSQTYEGNSRTARFKRAFDVSTRQEDNLLFGRDSLISRINRARKRTGRGGHRVSLENPHRLAEAIGQGLSPNQINSSVSAGMDNLVDALRNYDFSPRTLKLLTDNPESPLSKAFASALRGKSLFELNDSELPGIIEEVLERDLRSTFATSTTAQRTAARRMQNNLRSLLNQGAKQNEFWNLPAPNAARAAGISRRVDQLRNEFADYVVGTSDIRASSPQGFHSVVGSLLGDIETLFLKGSINKAERSEARTAILSLQVERARNSAYISDGNFSYLQHNRDTLSELLKRDPDSVKQLMKEFGQFKTGSGFVKRGFRKATAFDPYEVADEVNPFGSDTFLMPTFGTAFAKNPMKAMMGVSGLSWHPDAASGAAIPATHMVMRLNKYFETFGLGLDASQYKSPVNLFAAGMVGKRVLPMYAAAATAYSIDSTLGGYLNDRDQEGNRVYSPFFMGLGADAIAQGQIGLAGLIPGGQTAEEKREELFEGQVPIRRGRYWLLGNTPFKGERIQYFRPSWYQRFKSGSNFTPEMNETPMERLLFGYDFSPLRPLDPYRFERQNAETRPYPVSGDYFTGPYGPVTPFLNATVGKILKPRKQLVSDERLQYLMQQYAPVGDSGAYLSQTPILGAINSGYTSAAPGTGSANVFYPAMGYANPRGRASSEVRGRAESMAAMYSDAARVPGSYVGVYDSLVPYGVPKVNGAMTSRVISREPLIDYGSLNVQSRRLGYASQEMAGIYGFGFGTLRTRLGLGNQDMMPTAPMLEPASMGYSSGRSFWNLNIGGLGDLPMPIEGQYSNLELSEIIRRFVPKEPSSADYINPLPNRMGIENPWLPGINYPLAPLKTGDPYSRIPDATLRLPGTGYRRTNTVFGSNQNMSIANIHQILGDVAPWSQEYSAVDNMVDSSALSDMERALIKRTRHQVDAKRISNEFTPYEYKYENAIEAGQHPFKFGVGRAVEWLQHRDTYFNTKFLPVRTAVEDWERDNVYGATFPQWQTPIQSFLEPMMDKATQRDPISAALGLGTVGSLFGVSHKAKLAGSIVGGLTGLGSSMYGKAYEAITGDRYLPSERRKELALEEYIDILSYVKANRNAAMAEQAGDVSSANLFKREAQKTMYGANLDMTPEQLALAVPKRKREHFKAMLYAPEQERKQILSTAGRLERRLYQAAWGMDVEKLPDLNEYFDNHELPPLDSEFWSPFTSMDAVKVKVGQSMGIDMAQMGYFPQQIKEANLINPSYPNMMQGSNSSTYAQLQHLLYRNGGGNIQMIQTPFGGSRVELNMGTY
jgi:hypothetical protein